VRRPTRAIVDGRWARVRPTVIKASLDRRGPRVENPSSSKTGPSSTEWSVIFASRFVSSPRWPRAHSLAALRCGLHTCRWAHCRIAVTVEHILFDAELVRLSLVHGPPVFDTRAVHPDAAIGELQKGKVQQKNTGVRLITAFNLRIVVLSGYTSNPLPDGFAHTIEPRRDQVRATRSGRIDCVEHRGERLTDGQVDSSSCRINVESQIDRVS
jgi:hypothetical protein